MRRSIAAVSAFALALALASPPPLSSGLFGRSKKPPPAPNMFPMAPASLDIAPSVYVAAARPCANWAWGAAIESVARSHGVELKQEDVVVKAYGGALCTDAFGAADLARYDQYVTGDYTTDAQRRIHVEAVLHPGVPDTIEPLILAIMQKDPVLVLWRNRVFQLKGISYAGLIAPDGSREYDATEIRLADPLNAFPGESAVSIRVGDPHRDDFQGWMDIKVTDRLF